MIKTAFEYLFLLALFAPPAAVALGVLLLFIPPRSHRITHAPRVVGV